MTTSGVNVPERHRPARSLLAVIQVDELRPALIDSLGLFVAVSAHFGRECRRHGVTYSESLVGAAPPIDSAAAMSVFRIAQGFLQWIREEAGAKALDVRFEGDSERLTLQFIAHGIQAVARWSEDAATPRLASIALRGCARSTVRCEVTRARLALQSTCIPAHASLPPLAA